MDNNQNTELLIQIKKILDDNKATNITTIDLKDKSSIADYMVVASGTSSRHIQAVSEILLQQLKQSGLKHCTIEGKESDDWKLIDAIEVVVHIFHPEKRSLYNLEKIVGKRTYLSQNIKRLMKVWVICEGRINKNPEKELCNLYSERINSIKNSGINFFVNKTSFKKRN